MLAILALLAKGAALGLRVAPLLPSPPLRAAATTSSGRGGKAGSPIEPESGSSQSCATAAETSEARGSPTI